MAKSMREVMGDEPYESEDESESEDHGDESESELVADLADALGLDDSTARRVYDVMCAVVEAKGSGETSSSKANGSKKGKLAVASVLGR